VSELQKAAIAYAQEYGWKVHPLRGKIPLLTAWPERASSDPAVVAAYWHQYPDANIGLEPGASTLVVFDLDSAAARAEALALGLLSVPTLRVSTPRPGDHLYFKRLTPDALTPCRLRGSERVDATVDAMEVKCDRSNVVLPPSTHPNGQRYRVTERLPVADCPRHVWELLLASRELRPAKPAPAPCSARSDDSVIAQFNAGHSVAEILEAHDYARARKRGRFVAPTSTTGIPGVVILTGDDGKERAYSHHGNDPLRGRAHDAFDVFCLLDHGGDVVSAVRCAAQALGMDTSRVAAARRSTRPSKWRHALALAEAE
jgi:hypothetical protein